MMVWCVLIGWVGCGGEGVGCGFFFFKQKTAYEMRISDWSSDVCSSDLALLWVCLYCPILSGLRPRTIQPACRSRFRDHHAEEESAEAQQPADRKSVV